jgi:hypothetical protein
VPLVASDPLQEPEAAQSVALVVDHVSTAELPAAILVGLTDSATVGAG